MAQVKYLDSTGLERFWGIIKTNFITKTEADAKYAASLEVIGDGDSVAIALKNAAGQILPLTDGVEAAAVTIPLADEENVGLMSIADKAAIDGLATTYATIAAVEANELTVSQSLNDLNSRLNDLSDNLDNTTANARTYEVVAVTEGLATNVKEAYKLVDQDGTQAGATINIYKDSSLKSVALDGQTLNFTYILADGSESTVGVDVSTFLAESEFKNGLQVVNHEVSVKKDATSESFLSISADGVKVSGIQDAINTAVAGKNVSATGDTYVSATATDNTVTVALTDKTKTSLALADSALQGASGDDYVSASVTDKNVVVALTDKTKTSLALADTALQADDLVALTDVEIDNICTFE